MEEIEIAEVPGGRVRVLPDDAPQSPRDWGTVGHLVLDVARHALPWEDHTGQLPELCERGGWDLAARYLTVFHDAVVVPVWGYAHGDLVLHAGERIGCFADRWDSGQAGLAYLARDELATACGGSYPGDEQARAYLRGDVETYDQWARGQVVGYIAEQWTPCPAGTACEHIGCGGGHWVEIDACWGIYGIDDAITQGATTMAGGRHPR
ncbi:hypothetical protein Psed_6830 (plasmid) [Pseudonocardia dioxanivorans CB1190]|uniref:Uncharacterized protein n=1 Tax=Pseudonocardia dioxanivorans (strain ATCC 55486 / DSM 44775 / JCM 13855 / CB1190) TaxID=675635 RepID=F2L6K7_PSEUX|nr:hypothetical protein [Pseudonocardia dioxanivorans]AEA28901.1 hypothetical protein Psed_6830 [Pseudonocardia dioxanivorans CB1190]